MRNKSSNNDKYLEAVSVLIGLRFDDSTSEDRVLILTVVLSLRARDLRKSLNLFLSIGRVILWWILDTVWSRYAVKLRIDIRSD